MAAGGQLYKVTENTGSPPATLTGAFWWAGGGPMYYLPAGCGVGEQLTTETGVTTYYITKAAFEARDAIFGHVGSIPWL